MLRILGARHRDGATCLLSSACYPPTSLMNHAGIFQLTMTFPGASVLIDLTPREFMMGNEHRHTYHWWAYILVAVDSPFPKEPSFQTSPRSRGSKTKATRSNVKQDA